MKLVAFDRSALLPPERFYAEGVDLFPTYRRNDDLNEKLGRLLDGETNDGWSWEQKSVSSFHLRPTAWNYDVDVMHFLFDNAIPTRLEELTGRRLTISHVQIVKTIPGPSYQDWHRDAYQFGDEPLVGAFPPTIKVNFYPRCGKGSQPRLKFIRGSHRCMANDARFDAMLLSRYEHEILESDDDRALIFESSMLHGVVPDEDPRGSIRVMYCFVMRHEFDKRFANKEHHRRLNECYEQRLNSSSTQ